MAEVLKVENLHVHFNTAGGDVKALNGINFVQEEEEIFCLVGESGAGKSTLALAIMGLLPISAKVLAGRVIYDGVDLLRASSGHLRRIRGKEVSLVFQDAQAALNPVQTVGAQLEEVILAHGEASPRIANQMSLEILRELGLPEPKQIMNQYPFRLSGGMCQRVMLAIALVLRPRLLIADEATSGLDVTLHEGLDVAPVPGLFLLIEHRADGGFVCGGVVGLLRSGGAASERAAGQQQGRQHRAARLFRSHQDGSSSFEMHTVYPVKTESFAKKAIS